MAMLSYLDKDVNRFDTDILLVYDKKVSAEKVFEKVNELKAEGNRVFASSVPCKNIKYKTKIVLGEE